MVTVDDVQGYLTAVLGDAAVAERLAVALVDAAFDWEPPRVPVDEIDTLVVYAFGNRLDAAGRPVPGPMNEQLARVVDALVAAHPVRVYAQWEVAEVMAPCRDLVAIRPLVGDDGKETYLSTEGVASQIVAHGAETGRPLGRVAVVAWRDHAVRAVRTSLAAGMVAAAPAGVELPVDYDAGSGQPWTRDRFTYLCTDIMARLARTARP